MIRPGPCLPRRAGLISCLPPFRSFCWPNEETTPCRACSLKQRDLDPHCTFPSPTPHPLCLDPKTHSASCSESVILSQGALNKRAPSLLARPLSSSQTFPRWRSIGPTDSTLSSYSPAPGSLSTSDKFSYTFFFSPSLPSLPPPLNRRLETCAVHPPAPPLPNPFFPSWRACAAPSTHSFAIGVKLQPF